MHVPHTYCCQARNRQKEMLVESAIVGAEIKNRNRKLTSIQCRQAHSPQRGSRNQEPQEEANKYLVSRLDNKASRARAKQLNMRIAHCIPFALDIVLFAWILAAAKPVESVSAVENSRSISPRGRDVNHVTFVGDESDLYGATRRVESTGTTRSGEVSGRETWYTSERQRADDYQFKLRGTRRLNGAYDGFEDFDLKSAEAGFAFAVVLFIVLVVMLCCCCCPGTGCSLWDIVACLCIWELCSTATAVHSTILRDSKATRSYREQRRGSESGPMSLRDLIDYTETIYPFRR
jgi:hypothetical protein